MAMNVSLLLSLTAPDDLDLETVDGSFGETLRAAVEKSRQEKAAEASDTILEVLRAMEKAKTRHRDTLRRLRRQEKAEKQALDDLDRAWLYAQKEQNFGPLLVLLGLVGMQHREVTREVPEDWSPTKD
jgi:phosphoribosyl-ATP pyrophosphohydrolase